MPLTGPFAQNLRVTPDEHLQRPRSAVCEAARYAQTREGERLPLMSYYARLPLR